VKLSSTKVSFPTQQTPPIQSAEQNSDCRASLAEFVIRNVEWFKASATAPGAPSDARYLLYVYNLQLGRIVRSVALCAGFALIFVGTSVAFYTLRRSTRIGGQAAGGSATLQAFAFRRNALSRLVTGELVHRLIPQPSVADTHVQFRSFLAEVAKLFADDRQHLGAEDGNIANHLRHRFG